MDAADDTCDQQADGGGANTDPAPEPIHETSLSSATVAAPYRLPATQPSPVRSPPEKCRNFRSGDAGAITTALPNCYPGLRVRSERALVLALAMVERCRNNKNFLI
jgi:hypothetical protein